MGNNGAARGIIRVFPTHPGIPLQRLQLMVYLAFNQRKDAASS